MPPISVTIGPANWTISPHCFDQLCLENYDQLDQVDPQDFGLQHYSSAGPNGNIWSTGTYNEIVSLSAQTCSIELFGTSSFVPDSEAQQLVQNLQTLMDTDFPQLILDPKATLGDQSIFKAWTNWPVAKPGSPKRWGVTIHIYDYGPDNIATSISLGRPRQP